MFYTQQQSDAAAVQQSDAAAVIMDQLLALLNKDVVESFRSCTEFFNFFHMLCTLVLLIALVLYFVTIVVHCNALSTPSLMPMICNLK